MWLFKWQNMMVASKLISCSFWLLQASLIGEDIFYMVLQDVERAASCRYLTLLIQCGGNVDVSLSYKSAWSLLVFQHGAGRRARLQHLSDEPQWPVAVRRPSQPPPQRGAAAEHHPAGGRGRRLRQPRPPANRKWVTWRHFEVNETERSYSLPPASADTWGGGKIKVHNKYHDFLPLKF